MGFAPGWPIGRAVRGRKFCKKSPPGEEDRRCIMPDAAVKRHALNLPAGSVRAAHVLGVVGLENPPMAWQDFEAWISVVALVGLGLAAINHLFIQAQIDVPFEMPLWESILGSVIAFYFGARS